MAKVVSLTKKVSQKSKPANVLVYADFNCTTGFGNVTKELIDNWSNNTNWKITVLAINDMTEKPYNYNKNVFVVPCLSFEDKKAPYGRLELLKMLYNVDFDVFFALNDIEVLYTMKEHLENVKKERAKNNKKKTKYVVYFPIDSEPRKRDTEVLSLFDELITYTEYAKETLKPYLKESLHKKIKIVPHGVNTSVFKELHIDEIREKRKEIFGDKSEAIIFGTVNRNSARKDIGCLVVGYAMYKMKSQSESSLYLHCNPKDTAGINILNLMERLGLKENVDVFFPKDFSENKGVSESELNKIYNTFDYFLTTTTAEGWGLSVTEAMATKTLIVCPIHTSLKEITENGANVFGLKFQYRTVFTNDFEKIRIASTPEEIAHVMAILENLPSESQETWITIQNMINNAYNYVVNLTWKKSATKIKSIIQNLI